MTLPDPDAPLRLADAARLFGFKLAALRTEKRKGRLSVSNIAGKDYTTPSDIRRMVELCRDQTKAPAYGCDPRAEKATETAPPSGSLETETIKKAQAAAAMTARALKQSSRNPLPRNTPPSELARVIPLTSRSPTR
jgi:hypothetical protein